MNAKWLVLLVVLVLVAACNPNPTEPVPSPVPTAVTTPECVGQPAPLREKVFLAQDRYGNPVELWTDGYFATLYGTFTYLDGSNDGTYYMQTAGVSLDRRREVDMEWRGVVVVLYYCQNRAYYQITQIP